MTSMIWIENTKLERISRSGDSRGKWLDGDELERVLLEWEKRLVGGERVPPDFLKIQVSTSLKIS